MKAVYVVFMMLFAGIFLFSMRGIFSYHKDAAQNAGETREMIREVSQRMPEDNGDETAVQQIDFAKLKQINADAVGWIAFHDPYVNNPLVQTDNNSFYLNIHSGKRKMQPAVFLWTAATNPLMTGMW